jgi:hypothetical protein
MVGDNSAHNTRQFLRAEVRSACLPIENECSPFGYVSTETDWQGLSPLSWSSYFIARHFRRTPGDDETPVPPIVRSGNFGTCWLAESRTLRRRLARKVESMSEEDMQQTFG